MGHLWLSSTTPPFPAHPPPYMLIIVIEEIGYQRDQHHFHLVYQRCHCHCQGVEQCAVGWHSCMVHRTTIPSGATFIFNMFVPPFFDKIH